MSFINSIFLFAAAAAVIPIAIHLVRRIKARTVPFSSLMFLKATPKELIRKRRLRDKLLMALRCALIALLALVFARPFLPAERLPLAAGRENESVIVLIDRSFSMQYGDVFSRALAAARDRVQRAGPGDEIAVLAFDDQVELLADLDAEVAARSAALNGIEPGYRTTDFFPALQRAQEMLSDARNDRRVVVMISDFQEVGWSGALDNWKLTNGTIFEPIAIEDRAAENVYLDARIAGSNGTAAERLVTLAIDGERVDRRHLLPGTATVSFQQVYSREGYHQGILSLEDDELPADNRIYFTDRYGGRPEVLVVDESVPARSSDALFITNALDLGEFSRFGVTTRSTLQAGDLDRVDVVLLSHPATLSGSQRTTLRRFVENGGAAIISGGTAANANELSATLESLDLGRAERIVDTRADLGFEAIIGEFDAHHPVFAPFAGSGSGAILRPRFRRYVHIEPDEQTRVVGRFDSGDPFLVERKLGSGQALFYASTFGTRWTDLPLDEMFVPFLYELVAFSTEQSEERTNLLVGESIAVDGRPGNAADVRAPNGRVYRVVLDENGRGTFRQTDVPGHYRVEGPSGPRFYSVNVDPRESDLRRRGPEEAYAAIAPPRSDAPATPEEAVAAVQNEERKQKLWRWVLLLVIGLFGLETFVANRNREAGRSRAPNKSVSRRNAWSRDAARLAGSSRRAPASRTRERPLTTDS